MESPEKGPINLASDWKNKFSDIAKKVINEGSYSSKIRYEAPSGIFSEQIIADITLAKEKLGWFPVILLDEGLKHTFEYLEAQKGIRDPQKFIKSATQ